LRGEGTVRGCSKNARGGGGPSEEFLAGFAASKTYREEAMNLPTGEREDQGKKADAVHDSCPSACQGEEKQEKELKGVSGFLLSRSKRKGGNTGEKWGHFPPTLVLFRARWGQERGSN